MRLLGALTSSYLLFWSPLFLVTVFSWGDTWDTGTESTPHQVNIRVILVLLSTLPSGDSAPLLRARGRGAAGAAAASPRPRSHEAALTGHHNRSDNIRSTKTSLLSSIIYTKISSVWAWRGAAGGAGTRSPGSRVASTSAARRFCEETL